MDLLIALMEKIQADDAARAAAKTYLVFLGDLIDRGPQSREVIDYLLAQPWDAKFQPVFLKGNHEEFFLNVMNGDVASLSAWLTNGGTQCLESYGISRGWILNASSDAIIDRLKAQVPTRHTSFVNEMADTFLFGDYLFVHAGIRPGVQLDMQTGGDLRWIRDGFLDDQTHHGVMVVHGHTIVESPEERTNRIAIDTGAYRSGVLTAIGIEETDRWFLQASAPASASSHAR